MCRAPTRSPYRPAFFAKLYYEAKTGRSVSFINALTCTGWHESRKGIIGMSIDVMMSNIREIELEAS